MQFDPTQPFGGDPELRKQVAENVQRMLAVDGLYIGGDTNHPDKIVPLVVKGGVVASMRGDEMLAPDRFLPSFTVFGPFVPGMHNSGTALIHAERVRQTTAEGYHPAHDDGHDDGSLTSAAMAYAEAAHYQIQDPSPDGGFYMKEVPHAWPFRDGIQVNGWKPSTDPIRNLVKAGALIAAEIDRLQRLKK